MVKKAEKQTEKAVIPFLFAAAIIAAAEMAEIDPADYGVFVPSIPDLISAGLDKLNCADWLHGTRTARGQFACCGADVV